MMVAEYFLESLVLLKRLMCWTFSDIVFHSANVEHYPYKHWQAPAYFTQQHRNWSSADYAIYEHFNATLWRKIRQEEGSGFHEEVDAFKDVQAQVSRYCHRVYKYKDTEPVPGHLNDTTVEASRWTSEFTVTSADCRLLGPNPYWTQRRMQEESNLRVGDLIRQAERESPDTRTVKATC